MNKQLQNHAVERIAGGGGGALMYFAGQIFSLDSAAVINHDINKLKKRQKNKITFLKKQPNLSVQDYMSDQSDRSLP